MTDTSRGRLAFTVAKNEANTFEKVLQNFGLKPKRAVVTGQSFDPSAADIVKVIVALGGGAGIAAIIKNLAAAIAQIMRDKRRTVKLNGRSFENLSAEEIATILRAEAKIPSDTLPAKDKGKERR